MNAPEKERGLPSPLAPSRARRIGDYRGDGDEPEENEPADDDSGAAQKDQADTAPEKKIDLIALSALTRCVSLFDVVVVI